MAVKNLLERLADAGVSFTRMTQERAQGIVDELVRAGNLRAEDAQAAVRDLMERGREGTERLLDVVQREVNRQLAAVGVASKADLERLQRRVEALERSQRSAARGTGTRAPTKATATKTTAKKAAAKKASATKATAKKAAAKKATATKTTAKKAAAKKATAPPTSPG